MPNNSGGGNGAVTALLAILVIAVVAFGIWYVMNESAAEDDVGGAALQINLGSDNAEQ